jgi:hypothetical protein
MISLNMAAGPDLGTLGNSPVAPLSYEYFVPQTLPRTKTRHAPVRAPRCRRCKAAHLISALPASYGAFVAIQISIQQRKFALFATRPQEVKGVARFENHLWHQTPPPKKINGLRENQAADARKVGKQRGTQTYQYFSSR